MQLFRRFPLRYPRLYRGYIVEPADRTQYPTFAENFEVLDRELEPFFREFENLAQREQYWYRLTYVILLLGGALTSILIIMQIAFLASQGFSLAGTVVAAVVVGATMGARSFNHHGRYLDARLVAERLRGEYFLFLGYIDQYNEDKDRVQKLRERVVEIRQGGTV